MKEIDVSTIQEAIAKACQTMAFSLPKDVEETLHISKEQEDHLASKQVLEVLEKNVQMAKQEQIPLCQDTGMIFVYATIGQEVHFIHGNFEEAIQAGVAQGTKEYFLRASMVEDPVFHRTNTKNNTPAVIYTKIVPGDGCCLECMAKGFGSENMSRIQMMKPSDGKNAIEDFIVETVKLAGPNACPPMIVGVGIGGSFDYAAVLAKKALLRPIHEPNPDPEYAKMEQEILERLKALKIGPMGLGGKTTAFAVSILPFPTHIAGCPVAVNICCHACRHTKVVL